MSYDSDAKFKVAHSGSSVGEEETEAVRVLLESNFVGYGSAAKALEKAFCIRTGKRFGFAVSSGFHAVSLALRALDMPGSSLISMPVLTCPSLIQAVKGAGHLTALADISRKDLAVDVSTVHPASQAIIAPHAYGAPVDVKAINRLGLPWIEDCATSPATEVENKPAGSWGTISVFSFSSTKYITAGAGGMVLTDDAYIAERIRQLLDATTLLASCWKFAVPAGFPGRLADVNAAIALSQLRKMPMLLDRRRKIAKRYTEKLSGNKGLRLPEDKPGHSYYRYVVHTHGESSDLAERLGSKGIDARTSVNPWLDMIESEALIHSGLVNANACKEHLLSLPIHPSMTDDQVTYVADCLIELV